MQFRDMYVSDQDNKRSCETVMNRFTDDLWIEILLRLPVESLLRFKLVSKTWFSTISSHRFAKSHLETAPNDDDMVIVHHDSVGDKDDDTFSLFHLDSVRILEILKLPYSHSEYPIDEITSSLIGSDCGIVCVCIHSLNWRTAIKKYYDIYLWNPATRHSKPLPPCINILDNEKIINTLLGFGFDHIDLDFKVVRVVSRCVSGAISIFAKVYSSNRNGWRKIESKPINIYHYRNSFDVCFHGFLFMIGENNMSAFNLNKEFLIWDINLPAGFYDDATSSYETHVNVFKDTIFVTISNMDEGRIQLWTLDDEACLCDGGVSALWTKVLTVDVGAALDNVEHLFKNVQFSLFDADGYRFLYDLNKKVTKKIPDSLNLEIHRIFKYTKSMFSLEGFEQIKWAASSSD